jgi:hypothetical protein
MGRAEAAYSSAARTTIDCDAMGWLFAIDGTNLD